jgi:type III secretion protein Q
MTDVLSPPADTPRPLSLEPLDPAQASIRNHALGVMAALRVPGLRIAASLVEASAGPWILFGTDSDAPRLAIIDLDGMQFAPEDDAALLVALDRFEPLLAALEAATGLALEPSGVSSRPPPEGLSIAFDVTSEDAAAASRLILHVDAALAGAWPPAAVDLAADGPHQAVPIRGELVLEAAEVAASRVAALRPGDMVLTPSGPNRAGDARLLLAGRRLTGRFDPADHRFTVISIEESAMTGPPANAAVLAREGPDPDAVAIDPPVALRVMLGEVSLPLSELAGLRPGSTVVLGRTVQDKAAVLLAGEHRIATGQLVAVGEAYGLLIEHLATGA